MYYSGRYLWDSTEIPEQVHGTDGELFAIHGQVLLGLLLEVCEVLSCVQVQEGDAGLRVELKLEQTNYYILNVNVAQQSVMKSLQEMVIWLDETMVLSCSSIFTLTSLNCIETLRGTRVMWVAPYGAVTNHASPVTGKPRSQEVLIGLTGTWSWASESFLHSLEFNFIVANGPSAIKLFGDKVQTVLGKGRPKIIQWRTSGTSQWFSGLWVSLNLNVLPLKNAPVYISETHKPLTQHKDITLEDTQRTIIIKIVTHHLIH